MSEDTTLRELDGRALEAAACRIGTWTNQWRDPENGPFDGDESDYLRALAEVVISTYLAAASQEREPEWEYRAVHDEDGLTWPVSVASERGAYELAREGVRVERRTRGIPAGEWQRIDDEPR